jgi:sec-independent protein translocase protein TatA
LTAAPTAVKLIVSRHSRRCSANAAAAARPGEAPLIWKFLLILAIVLLIFGSTRLPTLARAFGQSISEFKKGIKEIEDQSDDKSNR